MLSPVLSPVLSTPPDVVDSRPQDRAGHLRSRVNEATLEGMDLSCAARVLRSQGGVIARTQPRSIGLTTTTSSGCCAAASSRAHAGVYVDHTGQPTWLQRGWAAVLFHWPAGLAGESALRAHGLRSVSDSPPSRRSYRDADWIAGPAVLEPVHVVVGANRRVVPPPGVVVTRQTDFDGRVQLHLSPPRLRLDEALLDVASACPDEAGAVALLADACQEGATTAARLHATLSGRGRLPRRRLLLAILDDVAAGSMSVFERRYLRDVERSHGLPRRGGRSKSSRGGA